MKASLFSLISVWQRGWSWRCFRYRPLRARLCLEKKINKLKSPSVQALCQHTLCLGPKMTRHFWPPWLGSDPAYFFSGNLLRCEFILSGIASASVKQALSIGVKVWSSATVKRKKLSSWGFKDLIRTQKLKSWDYFLLYRGCQTPIRTNVQHKKIKHPPRKEPCGWNDLNNKNGHLDSLHGGGILMLLEMPWIAENYAEFWKSFSNILSTDSWWLRSLSHEDLGRPSKDLSRDGAVLEWSVFMDFRAK